MVVVKLLVFVSEVVSIFSKILTWIIGGAKGYRCPTNSIIGGACPGCPPKSTPMDMEHRLSQQETVLVNETATALGRLEEGQCQLAFTQAHQTAEVSDI